MAQATFTVGSPRLQSRLLARRQEFDNLFEGYHRLQAVSYVVTPDLLLHFFDKRGFSEVEVVVGENHEGGFRLAPGAAILHSEGCPRPLPASHRAQ